MSSLKSGLKPRPHRRARRRGHLPRRSSASTASTSVTANAITAIDTLRHRLTGDHVVRHHRPSPLPRPRHRRRRPPRRHHLAPSRSTCPTATASTSATPTSPSGEHDVCVVGATDHAVELTVKYVDAGPQRRPRRHRAWTLSRLSPAGSAILRQLEHDRQATILYRSTPKSVTLIDGHPLIEFLDRHTPDLQFDAVVFAPPRLLPYPGRLHRSPTTALASRRVWFVGQPDASDNEPGTAHPDTVAPGNQIGMAIAEACFPELDISQMPSPTERRALATRGSSTSCAPSTTTPPSPASTRTTPTCGSCGSGPTPVRPRSSPASTPRSASATGSRASTTPTTPPPTPGGTS